MPMKSKAITPGMSYIGDSGELLRMVISISEQKHARTIMYRSFSAQDGAYIAERMCDLASFARWAAREVTLAEHTHRRPAATRPAR